MASYRRVTYRDRCQIEAYLQVSLSVAEMSRRLGFHRSTLYREIARNRRSRGYRVEVADVLARHRFRQCRRKLRIRGSCEQLILQFLANEWSPQQIEGRFALEQAPMVSHQTIYRFIRRHYHRRLKRYLRTYNRRGGSRYCHRRQHKAGKAHISERSAAADRRSRLGDWERDTLYAARGRQVLVCTDRRSRYTKLAKLRKRDLRSVANQTLRLLRSTGRKIYTLTNDNGPEFRSPVPMGVPVYYCTPHKPHERGTVENTIGLIRQYIKRKTDLDQLSDYNIKCIENKLNHRPRKCLDYKTPFEVFYGKSVALVM